MVNYCHTHKCNYIKILCDSQAAILALNSRDIRSNTVLKAVDALNAVAEITQSETRMG